MQGRRFSSPISWARRCLRIVSGKYVPPLTVESLATMTHSRPLTRPMPVTRPADGISFSCSPQAASGESSRNGLPGSISLSIRSLGSSLPRLRWVATALSGPPRRTCPSRSRSCAASFRWWSALDLNCGEAGSVRLRMASIDDLVYPLAPSPAKESMGSSRGTGSPEIAPPKATRGFVPGGGARGLAGAPAGDLFLEVFHDIAGVGARAEKPTDPKLCEFGSVVGRNDAPAAEEDVVHLLFFHEGEDFRKKGHVRAGEDGNADGIGVLLEGGVHDHLAGLMQSGVDHLETGMPEGRHDDFGAAVVAVQAGLGDDDPELPLGLVLHRLYQ